MFLLNCLFYFVCICRTKWTVCLRKNPWMIMQIVQFSSQQINWKQRKGRIVTTVRHGKSLRKSALGVLQEWKLNGMAGAAYLKLRSENSVVLNLFHLVPCPGTHQFQLLNAQLALWVKNDSFPSLVFCLNVCIFDCRNYILLTTMTLSMTMLSPTAW